MSWEGTRFHGIIGTSFEVGEGEQFWVNLSQQGFQKHHWKLEDVAAQKSP